MKSMTGSGSARFSFDSWLIQIHVQSVNRKGLDIAFSLPREWVEFEIPLRNVVSRFVQRGRVQVQIKTQATSPARAFTIDRERLHTVAVQLRQLTKELKLSDSLDLHTLLQVPGAFVEAAAPSEPERLLPALVQGLERALQGLDRERQREGRHLKRSLHSLVKAIKKELEAVDRRSPAVLQRMEAQLAARLQQASLLNGEAQERLLRETVIFSDRCDTTEERVRLRAHLDTLQMLLGEEQSSIGRQLEFLLQEIGREINTIGSKANDLTISQAVVRMKTALEKLREQVQNVE